MQRRMSVTWFDSSVSPMRKNRLLKWMSSFGVPARAVAPIPRGEKKENPVAGERRISAESLKAWLFSSSLKTRR